MRGDPASALLEVLDPEQKRHLPRPLPRSPVRSVLGAVRHHGEHGGDHPRAPARPHGADRAERLHAGRKAEIARRYLIPKKIAENGLTPAILEMTDGAITAVIEGYTMEAGVRNLERQIGSSAARSPSATPRTARSKKQVVTEKEIPELLGVRRYQDDPRPPGRQRSGRGDRPRVDQLRRHHADHRGLRHARQGGDPAHGQAGRRDEGVRPRGDQLHPRPCRPLRHPARGVRETDTTSTSPRARPRRTAPARASRWRPPSSPPSRTSPSARTSP